MQTKEDQDRAARLWKVGQIYRSKHFQDEYIKVIAIGEEMIFACVYMIRENKKPFMSWLKDFRGKRYQRKVIVDVLEDTKNKFFFGWELVKEIPEIAIGSPSVRYNYIRRTEQFDLYDIPEGHYAEGKQVSSWFADRKSVWTILKEGQDTLFLQTVVDGEIHERVRTKRLGFWT